MITNKDMTLELLAFYGQLLTKEKNYLENSNARASLLKLLDELSNQLFILCCHVDMHDWQDEIKYKLTIAKTLCRELSEQAGTFHHNIANVPSSYSDMCVNILNVINQFEQLQMEERTTRFAYLNHRSG